MTSHHFFKNPFARWRHRFCFLAVLLVSIYVKSFTYLLTYSLTYLLINLRTCFRRGRSVPPAIDEANLVDNPKIVVNRTVLLECPVSGSPAPDVQWLKNSELLSVDANIEVEGRYLEIRRARISDSARYTCVASNEAGQLRRSFDLEVLGLLRP